MKPSDTQTVALPSLPPSDGLPPSDARRRPGAAPPVTGSQRIGPWPWRSAAGRQQRPPVDRSTNPPLPLPRIIFLTVTLAKTVDLRRYYPWKSTEATQLESIGTREEDESVRYDAKKKTMEMLVVGHACSTALTCLTNT